MKNRSKDSWRKEINSEMQRHGESFSNVESIAPEDLDLDKEFDSGYGGSEGKYFTLWTTNRVYFPVVYDGAEWVGSVARNPDGVATEHFGGQ